MNTKTAFKSAEGKQAVLTAYESLLEKWPVPHERCTIKTRHGDTFLLASGEPDAPPLLLLHGTSMNSAMWMGDVATYARQYRVYAVDLPGEPGNSADSQLPLASTAYAEWLHDVFTALSIDKGTLVGMSLGGWLSIQFAVNYPAKIEKLVLLSPSGIGPQRISFLFTALPLLLFGEKGKDRMIRKINGNPAIPDAMIQYQKLIGQHFNLRGKIPLFSDEELQRLTMPTALYVGAKDLLLDSEKTVSRFEKLLPHANIQTLPEAGHSLTNLTEEILDFLTR